MASTAVADEVLDGSNPAVARLRQLIGGPDSKGACGCLHTMDQRLVKSGTLPCDAAAVLVPGCGAVWYDVVALSGAGRFVVGLDICETAIQKAKQWSSSASADDDGSFFAFVAADFFTWEPPEKFDLVFDYTFFCALHPPLRQAWAKRMSELLKPDGELITLMYLVEGQEAGPPFNTTVLDYEVVLNPLGFVINSIQDNEAAVELRKGREKIARWKRMAQPVNLHS